MMYKSGRKGVKAMVSFDEILGRICEVFSDNVGEPVTPDQVGIESIRLSKDEIDYPGIEPETLPEWVIVHMFIFEDWSGHAVVDLKQKSLYGLGTFCLNDSSSGNRG